MSVYVALLEKQLSFELDTVDLASRAHHAEHYVAMSLTQRVPTLVHGDFALSESSAIVEYLEETFPANPVYPQDTQQRARARQIQAWLRSDLMPLRVERPTEVLFYGPTDKPLSEAARAASEKLFAAAAALLPVGASHLFGGWCIADLDLALMLSRLVLNGDAVPQRLVEYASQQWQRPSARRWQALTRPASAWARRQYAGW